MAAKTVLITFHCLPHTTKLKLADVAALSFPYIIVNCRHLGVGLKVRRNEKMSLWVLENCDIIDIDIIIISIVPTSLSQSPNDLRTVRF